RSRGRPAEVEEEAGRRRVRIVEDEVAVRRHHLTQERRAAGVHQLRARVAPRLRIGGDGGRRGRSRGGAEGDELAAFHRYRLSENVLGVKGESPARAVLEPAL